MGRYWGLLASTVGAAVVSFRVALALALALALESDGSDHQRRSPSVTIAMPLDRALGSGRPQPFLRNPLR